MQSLWRLLDLVMAFCCLALPFSVNRRNANRKTWTRYAPVALTITVILFFMNRSHQSKYEENIVDFEEEDEDFIYRRAIIEPQSVHLASLKSGITIHVAMGLIFISQDPHAAANAKDTITWILVYSTAPIHFHLLTDSESIEIITQIMKRAEKQANCPFTYTVETLTSVFDTLLDSVRQNVPQLKLTMLQEHLITKMLPLLLHWYYPNMKRLVMVNGGIKFRTNIVELYEYFDRFESSQVIGMTLTQNAKFATSFAVYRHLQSDKEPDKYMGLSPPEGWPGFNTDLILLDLEKMRDSSVFRRYLDLENQFHLVKKYDFQTVELLPQLDEWITLVGAEKPELFYTLPCEWNVQQIIDTNAFPHCQNNIKAMQFGD